MSSPTLDRQLLFAILAFQNAFLSREDFLTAANIWMEDKSIPFEQILVDRGVLTPDEFQLLGALVKRHVEIHGDDPQQSLAGLSSIGTLREELEQLGDADIAASIVHVAAERSVEDTYATQPVTVGQPTSGNLRFRILRPHARGGLGEVHVALDEELHREVALKEIQSRRADDVQTRQRFVLEAEITGALEHPGIVPVYGLGQYADGRPFYAMKFIRGDSLAEAIAVFHRKDGLPRDAGGWTNDGERALELRGLLGRFIDVCNAIHYAHIRGVLHRDIKPGNIMLGKHGETLVVDWGLAKSIGEEDHPDSSVGGAVKPLSAGSVTPTLMGSAIGTPAFMSPEQASGRLGEVGRTADVFSLGATLYCLLTGQAPFSGENVAEILRRATKGEFAPPREVKRETPRPLQGICLQAMALQPAERYATVAELAEDIERWLADEPVRAYRETTPERLSRWMRRNIGRVYAALGLLLLVFVVTIGLISTRAAQQRADDADRFAAALDHFLTEDLSKALLNASPTGKVRSYGGALSEASAKFVKTVPDNPDLQLRMVNSFGEFLLHTGELDGAERQFEAARALVSQPDVPPSAIRQVDVGAAIVRWRRGDAGALEIVEKIRSELGKDEPEELRRWIDLEFASALKNSTRDREQPERLDALDQATQIYKQYAPNEDAPPDDVSLNVAEMMVERANVLQGEERASQMRAARDALGQLTRRMSITNDQILKSEVWAEYAKALHRLGQLEEADDAYFQACTQLCDVLGTQHWRTTETAYSWMSLLNKSFPKAQIEDAARRRKRGRNFYLKYFLRTNTQNETKIEQNGIGNIAQLPSENKQEALPLDEWLQLDKSVRAALLEMKNNIQQE